MLGVQHTHIILAKVDTFCSNGDSNVHTVIDQQRHIVCLSDLVQLFSCLDKNTSIIGFVSVLDNSDSWMVY